MSDLVRGPQMMLGAVSRRSEFICVGALLLLHGMICISTASIESITHDEIWHLPVGARNLSEGRFDIERVNPPLSRMWAAVPLVLAGVDVDRQTVGQELGRKFVEGNSRDFRRWYFRGRLAHLLWSLATATLVWIWSRQLFGGVAALLSLLLYVTCPNITAHASVITPDAAAMCSFVAVLWAVTLWSDRPSWKGACLWGILLGLAEGMKFTNLLLYPLVAVISFVRLRNTPHSGERWWSTPCLQFGLAILIGQFVLCASYGFQGVFRPLAAYHFQSSELKFAQALLAPVSGLPVPCPGDYLLGIDEQRMVMDGQHPVFLDGQWSLTGFRSYFLRALLYKLPHILQILICLAGSSLLLGYPGPTRRIDALTLLLPVGLIVLAASGESLQLGLRYVLPALPLLMIFAGAAVDWFRKLSQLNRRAIVICGAIACGWSLRFHPGHLAYFNEWAGGPLGGRQHLIDSNLDWGQDLDRLNRFLARNNNESIGLAYFGTVPPALVGLKYDLPPSWRPKAGLYAVSVNFVMGRPHGITLADGSTRGVDFGEFSYFRNFMPVQNFGGSIDLYEISPEDVQRFQRALEQASGDRR